MSVGIAAATWIKANGRDTFRSWDFFVAVGCGGIAFGLGFIDDVRDAAVPVLITEAAIGVALTATVFGAIAVFATFYDGAYRRVLEIAGGFHSALMPYIVIGVVAAAAGIVGLIGALALPALGAWPTAIVLGTATLLCAWALTGTVALIELTLFHATERAHLMEGADYAESVRARRLKDPGEKPPPGVGMTGSRNR